MINPLIAPLLMTSATTIALRTMMMWPVEGRHSSWQRKEAGRMVSEKLAAIQESQLEAMTLAWRATWMPWTVWTPGGYDSRAVEQATGKLLEPFSGRAASNARRLTARAMRPLPMVASKPRRGS
jgi:hypothetical protein